MRLRPTHGLGALAVGGTLLAAGLEYAHVWRRGHAPAPRRGHVLEAGRIAAEETLQVAREGYRSGSPRENVLLNMLLSFAATFAGARAITHAIRRWGSVGPLRNMRFGDRHVHHLVPGIVLALLSGTAGIISGDERYERWIALPFGSGAALTLDEAALLLELEDVYWSEEGVLSVQVTLAAMALLAAGELTRRAFSRGEARVLTGGAGGTHGEPLTAPAGRADALGERA